MVLRMLVSKRALHCYEESQRLIGRLSTLSREERLSEYEKYQWMFSIRKKMMVNLEDQFSARQDYKDMFREWFFVVCSRILSNGCLGECCYSLFREDFVDKGEKAPTSDRYSQKVILALGMLGYLTRIKSNYSNSGDGNSHGTIFEVDMHKLNGWDNTLVSIPIEKDITMEDCKNWLWSRQFATINSIEVIPKYLDLAKAYLHDYDEFCENHEWTNEERQARNKKWWAARSLLSVGEKETYRTMTRHKQDDYGGRFYTIMTGMSKELRHNCLSLDMERLCEVDISSAQPTFLGLLVHKTYPCSKSLWLEHCLSGTLYEWLGEVLDMPMPREIIKGWVMKFLYSSTKVNGKDKKWKSTYKYFETRLTKYLKENEPCLYEICCESKQNPSIVKRKKPTKTGNRMKKRNDLSKQLVGMEVAYIKQCIANLPDDVKFYTIHDCICCKESDAEIVKAVMEKTSMDMWGVKIKLKIENQSQA